MVCLPQILLGPFLNFTLPHIFSFQKTITRLYQLFYTLKHTEIQYIKSYVLPGKPNTSFLIVSTIVRLCSVSNDNMYSRSLECLLLKKNFLAPFYGWGSLVSGLHSHHEKFQAFDRPQEYEWLSQPWCLSVGLNLRPLV